MCKDGESSSGRLEKKQPCEHAGERVIAMTEYVYNACCCPWALSIYHRACLPHPSPFEGVIDRLWATTWKEEACFNRYKKSGCLLK